LASTAWTSALQSALQCARNATSLARCRTTSRNSRTAGGAIHASANLPIRNRSARSAASRSSFVTRRYSNALTPNGCARCTTAPNSTSASTAQYQPYVASNTTSGACPARAITNRQPLGVVDDPHRLQTLAGLGHPHHHRPAPVQINPDELLTVTLTHRGLLRRRT
jgi:hypothetical protein